MVDVILYMFIVIMIITFIITQIIICIEDKKRNKAWIKEIDKHIEEIELRKKVIKQGLTEETKSVQKKKRTKKDEVK